MTDTENEVMTVEGGSLALLNRSEIDMQIATAHKFPRSLVKFRTEVLQMVTLNERVAQECIYSLPRREFDKDKNTFVTKAIEGPSARFAEVIISGWGNSRAGARMVSDEGDYVTCQGMFHDLERNVALTYEVSRRIVDSKGKRYKADMIGVTANAGNSIALRNVILKGVPKAFWADMYDSARETAIGNVQTLVNRRSRALQVLQKMGVQPETVYAFLRINGQEDITLDHLGMLFGITTALREGDTTPELAFALEPDAPDAGKPKVSMPQAKTSKEPPAPAERPPANAPVDQGTGEIRMVADAPAASPAPAAARTPREGGASELATAGERKMIINRAKSNELDINDLLDETGLQHLKGTTELEGLTKDGFLALRDALPKAV